jgi:drug/metabolite transporter (DMT)-like permease
MIVLVAGLVYAALASPPAHDTGWLFLGTGIVLLVVASVLWALDLVVNRVHRRR